MTPTPLIRRRRARRRLHHGHQHGRCAWKTLLVAAVVLAGTAPFLAAQPAVTSEANRSNDAFLPSFYIESIEVEGLEHGPEIAILNQSLLQEGLSYTELQIREAAYRIRRLPFVYDATPRLQKGSQVERYILVFEITEAHRFFSRFETRYVSGESGFRDDFTVPDFAVGGRLFVGKNGVLFAGLDDDEGGALMGYTQYNLFGTRASATFSFGRTTCCAGNGELVRIGDGGDFLFLGDFYGVNALFVVPLRGNHFLQFEVSYLEHDEDRRTVVLRQSDLDDAFILEFEIETEMLVGGLAWGYDSRDDIFLPTSGRRALFGVSHQQLQIRQDRLISAIPGPPPVDLDFGSIFNTEPTRTTTHGELDEHWALPKGSLNAGLSGRYTELDSGVSFIGLSPVRSNVTTFAAEVGYSLPLLPRKWLRGDKFRFETNLRHEWNEYRISGPPSPFQIRDPNTTWDQGGLYAGVAYRNRWTVLRLGAEYQYGGPR